MLFLERTYMSGTCLACWRSNPEGETSIAVIGRLAYIVVRYGQEFLQSKRPLSSLGLFTATEFKNIARLQVFVLKWGKILS